MAGVYSNVVSTVKQIDSIYTFIGGTQTKIDTAWTFVNGERKQVFPSSEVYTEVYAKTSAGSYSTSLGYGRYKIVISGGGGSGAALAYWSYEATDRRYSNSGTAGEEITFYIDIPYGETKTISGVVGQGGQAGWAQGQNSHHGVTAATGGTGYQNGNNGGTFSQQFNPYNTNSGWVSGAAGAGGGSTSVEIDNVLQQSAKGGNGGNTSIRVYGVSAGIYIPLNANGGTGGGGGTTTGTGSAGGSGAQVKDYAVTANAGTDGYVHIYQNSIYPN